MSDTSNTPDGEAPKTAEVENHTTDQTHQAPGQDGAAQAGFGGFAQGQAPGMGGQGRFPGQGGMGGQGGQGAGMGQGGMGQGGMGQGGMGQGRRGGMGGGGGGMGGGGRFGGMGQQGGGQQGGGQGRFGAMFGQQNAGQGQPAAVVEPPSDQPVDSREPEGGWVNWRAHKDNTQ